MAICRYVVAFGMALLLAFSGCQAQAVTIYKRGNPGDPGSLDPQLASTVVESDVLLDLYEGLVTLDPRGEPVPGMAESWSINEDGTRYTFRLRSGARWSNGDAVRAHDFVFSLRRLLSPATGAKYANLFHVIRNAEAVHRGEALPDALGVHALDDATVEITLNQPVPYFIGMLTLPPTLPVHPASVEKFGKDFVRPENMVSNGAFTLHSFTPKDAIVLRKNPHYRDAANVQIDQVEVISLEDRAAALRRFQAGELHTYNDVPADQIKLIHATLKGQFRVAPYLGTYYLALNTRKPPFDDVRVRQALSMVIDRQFLAEEIWSRTMLPAYSFIPPGIGNYGKPATVEWMELPSLDREEKAKALLKEAGYGPGGKPLTIEIRYNTSDNNKNTSVALATMWKPFNIEARLVNSDLKTHYAALREKGDFDVARAGWIADYSDPHNFLFLAESTNTSLNYARYANPAFDALMATAASTRDIVERARILHEAERILLRDHPVIPLLFYSSKNLVSDKVVGFETNVLDRHLSRHLQIRP